jgi:hypothetical protein
VLCVLGLNGIGLHVGIATFLVDIVGVFDLGLVALGLQVGIGMAHGRGCLTE